MNNKSIIKGFLFPTLLQITVVAALVGILNAKGYELGYNSFLGMVFIIFGGVSSALWGVFYQIKYNAKRPLSILKDFFDIKQSIKIYAVVLVFLFMDFCSVIVSKGFKIESLLILLVLFFKAIAFGGIEEIGWRYSFQPCLEKKIPYIDDAGTLIKPEEPNGYKFETLILDMIQMMDTCLPFEVERDKEFAPIKNKTGIDSVESARALLTKNGVTL